MKRGAVRCSAIAGAILAALASVSAAQTASYRFDFARQPLADAIIRASRVVGMNVLFEGGILAGREAPVLRGEMTASEAFDRLLAGSGLVARQTDSRSIYIERGGENPPASVASAPANTPNLSAARLPGVAAVFIEEVIVTAQKREEFLQSVPVVVQVMTDNTLQRAGVKDFTTINKVASNIQVAQGAGAPVIALRGIRANAPGAASESPTAVHLDGNYLSQAVSQTGMFFDLERVEVLAGPQGTLFGRNAVAGVINIITRKPQPEFAAGAELEAGSDSLVRATGVLNLPVSETVAMRVAGQSLVRDGYFANGLDDADQQSARAGVAWIASDLSRWLFTADYSRNTPRGPADNLVIAGVPGNGLEAPPLRDNSLLYGSAARASRDQEFWGAALQFDHDFSGATFTLQASYRDVYQLDRIYGAQNLANPVEFGRSHTLEARVASLSGGKWEYVGGLYFLHESKYGGTATYADLFSETLATQIRILGQETDAGAAFGQVTYTPRDRLHLTLGLRYNYDYKWSSSLVLAPPDTVFYQAPEADHWDKLTWKGSVGFDLRPESLVFASIATGYKSGTFAFGPTPRVNPQDVLAYEIGTKNRFFDDRLQLNFNAYYSDYQSFEQPYTTPIPGTTFFLVRVTNTGGAIIRGADLEADWAATATDRFRARINYLDTEYRQFDLTPFGGLDYSGRALTNTPPWAVNVGYTRTWRGPVGTVDFNVDTQYRASRGISTPGNYDLSGEPFLQEAHTVVDLGLRYLAAGGNWSLAAYANNAFDEVYFSQANFNSQRGYNVYAQIAPPRTYGLILGVNF